MCASWNNAEIKIEKVSEKEVKLQSYEDLKKESAKAIREMKRAVDKCEMKVGQTVDEYVYECQNAINDIRYAFEREMLALGIAMDYTALNEELYSIIYTETQGAMSRRGFFDVASECRQAVNDYINSILKYDPDEDDMKLVVALRYMIGNENRNNEDVFYVFANSIVYVCENVACKFERWFGKDYKREIFSAVGQKVSSECTLKQPDTKKLIRITTSMLLKPDDKIFEDVLWKIDRWEEVAEMHLTRNDVERDIQDRRRLKGFMQ